MTETCNGTLVPGRTISKRYRIERTLGVGGMGVVYEVVHVNLGRRFALKLLHPGVSWNGEAMERFRHEAQVTSRIGHPNIIDVVDFDTSEAGEPFLVMELLEGETLGRRLEAGRLSPAAAVAIGYQTAMALGAAHRQNVVHRDLKPDNVFLCSRGSWPDFVKVLDFGISKILGSSTVLTGNQTLLGSPRYMAPEQAMGRSAQCDGRTDIHALGVVLWEALAGRAAFEADNVPAVLGMVCSHTPPPVDAVNSQVPRALAEVLARAMEKDPARRFQDVEQFGAALVHSLPSDLRNSLACRIAPAAAPPVDRAPRPVPRKVALKWLALGGLTGLLGLVGAIVVTERVQSSRQQSAETRTALAQVQPLAPERPSPVPTPPAPPEPRVEPAPVPAPPATPEPRVEPAPVEAAAPTPTPAVPVRSPPRTTARTGTEPGNSAKRPATLVVSASVLSKVYLDGRLVDETPVRLTDVAAGRHTLEVVGSLDPACRSTRTLDLAPGQVTKVAATCPTP